MSSLLRLLWTLDRRAETWGGRRSARARTSTLARTVIAYGLLGGVTSTLVSLLHNPLLALSLVHLMLGAVVATGLMHRVSPVLLESKHAAVLGPLPISSRTLLCAHLLHAGRTLGFIAICFCLVPAILVTRFHGPLALTTFMVSVLAGLVFTVALTQAVQLLSLRWIKPQRLAEVALYLQLGLALLVVLGRQLIPRLLGAQEVAEPDPDLNASWWLVPPLWLAGLALSGARGLHATSGDHTAQLTIMALAATAVAAALLWRLAPAWSRARQTTQGRQGRRQRIVERRSSPWQSLGRIGTRPGVERAAFDWVWSLLDTQRRFRLRAYLNGCLSLILSIFLILQLKSAQQPDWLEARSHLFILYLGLLLLPSTVADLRFSEQPEAGWIYRTLPFAAPGPLLAGALKAVTWRYLLPAFGLLVAVAMAVWSIPQVLLDALLASCSLWVLVIAHALLRNRALPFSEPLQAMQQNYGLARMLGLALLALVLGVVHSLLTTLPWGRLLGLAALSTTSWLLLRAYASTPWSWVRS